MQQILPSLAELTAHAQQEPAFAAWQAGYGPVQHSAQTQAAVFRLAHQLVQSGQQPSLAQVYQLGALQHTVTETTPQGCWPPQPPLERPRGS